jgi:hypothetical protein
MEMRSSSRAGVYVARDTREQNPYLYICRPFKEPSNRFPAWQAGTTTLFVVPARKATKAGGID